MESPSGEKINILEELARQKNAYKFSFFRLCREVDRLHPHVPRMGKALKPAQEKVRFGQEPFFEFSATALREVSALPGGYLKVIERFLGLFGPNGPMPMQFADYVRSRSNHFHDHTIADFLDIFQHRAAVLFFRAWAIGRAEVSYDRPKEDYFGDFISCLIGMSPEASRNRNALSQQAKLYHSGALAGMVKSPQKLCKILQDFFEVEVTVNEFIQKWYPVPRPNLSRLGSAEAALGESSLLGEIFCDGNLKFSLVFKTLDFEKYVSMTPAGKNYKFLNAWIRQFLNDELECGYVLIIKKEEIPSTTLGGGARLGWTSWLRSEDYEFSEDQEVKFNLQKQNDILI